VGVIYNRAVTHKENNKLDDAIEDFMKVIEMNPSHDNAYYNIGIILYQMGKRDNNMDFLKGAIKYFQKAEKLGNQQAANILNKLR
jgi:tetratricopeptide (TPR) repeat protein